MPENQFEILHPARRPEGKIRAAIFDFDGTFSTLRCGWEGVMRPLMLEMISGGSADRAATELREQVDSYIDESTGIQTIYQMQWLRDRVNEAGYGSSERDEWWYKAEYNRRLMEEVRSRLCRLETGDALPEKFLIAGSIDFLRELKKAGIECYLASGTDHSDVVREAGALGVLEHFVSVRGAPEHKAACSKEAVIRMILTERGLKGENLLLVGDGKVEIALGAEAGAYTLGAATDEVRREGVNPKKREKLIRAGADAITGDFSNLNALSSWLGI